MVLICPKSGDWVRMSKIYQKKIKFLDIKMQLDTINISDIDQDIKLPRLIKS